MDGLEVTTSPADKIKQDLLALRNTSQMTSQEDGKMSEILKRAAVDLNEPLSAPPVCLEVEQEGQRIILGTYGNFSVHIGKAKSGKTFWMSLFVSAVLKGDLFNGKLKPSFIEGKSRIKWYDTEQGRFHVQKVGKRVLRSVEMTQAPEFEIFCLRSVSTMERLAAIEHDLYNSPGVAVAVIDGIRDLIHDINDPKESSMIVGKLLKWSEELNIHIMVVLHQNKGDFSARGHLGTEAVNKAETVIEVGRDKDSGLFTVTPHTCRDMDFNPFAFEIDGTGCPVIVDQFVSKDESPLKGKKTAADISASVHLERLREAFLNNEYLPYAQAWGAIKAAFDNHGQTIGANKAKEYLSHYQIKSWIIQSSNKGRTLYSFSPPV